MASRTLVVHTIPGRVPYGRALAWQRRLARRRIDGELDTDLLLLLEHEPVVTLGRGHHGENVVGPTRLLAERGIERVEIERGGDVTYHGPGQLVGYPILHLHGYRADLHWYLRQLEKTLAGALGALGLPAFRVGGFTGVWVGEGHDDLTAEEVAVKIRSGAVRKIASIGVHVSRWVTWHGFALNVTEEALGNFRLIVPCGIEGVRMTSVRSEGVDASITSVGDAVVDAFASVFDVRIQRPSAEETRALLASATEPAGALRFE